jgi:xylulose-5-phosphate/fructose-6-phosphate phosphoketolase
MAQGVANSGKQAIITNYEAFFQITSSMVKQYLKFRKQADEANGLSRKLGNQGQYRAAVPNMVLHLSSLGFAQDHNGFSHQNFGFVNDLATEPRRYVEVLMPAEANSAVLAFDRAVKGKNKVVAVVADKQPRRQFLSPREAAELVRVGGAVWSFASSVDGVQQKPDVVLAASGGYHTDEVLAAARILREFNSRLEARGDRGVRFTTVNVVAPFKLRAPEGATEVVAQRVRELGGRGGSKGRADRTVFDQATFERLFPAGVPIVYAFGGAQTTAEGLFAGREREVSAHGYRNEGSTTTRFDMMVRNGCDRFSLVIDAVERAYRMGTVSAAARDEVQRWCRGQLGAHARRMKQNV